jgi:hypothetical protein
MCPNITCALISWVGGEPYLVTKECHLANTIIRKNSSDADPPPVLRLLLLYAIAATFLSKFRGSERAVDRCHLN